MSKSEYPAGEQGECRYDETKAAFKNGGMVQERYVSNEALKEMIVQQPVSTGIVITPNFRFYHSGILTEDFLRCSDSEKKINHSVTLVGYGKVDKKEVASSWCSQYWLVANSWGPSWGEQGFFKLCMDGAGHQRMPYGACQVNRFPSYPTVAAAE